MEIKTLEEASTTRRVIFHRVAENLYRLESNGGYYALLKRGDKQYRRSLRTKDRKLADRRLSDLRTQVTGLAGGDEARLTFDDLAKRWMVVTTHTLKPRSIERRWDCIRSLKPFFSGLLVRNIQRQHCERWLTERAKDVAAMTANRELELMRAIFNYGMKIGVLLQNPAVDIERRRVVQAEIQVPTKEQFRIIIHTMRNPTNTELGLRKASAAADLIELLAYSGCRLREGTSLKWRDVDFEKNTLTVSGGDKGTKNLEVRIVPMTLALRNLLTRLHGGQKPSGDDSIIGIASARSSLAIVCRNFGLPPFSHHDFRHFYATTCIEAGVDIPTVSRWLGHKDGGALAMRVYGHLRSEHSQSMAKLVAF